MTIAEMRALLGLGPEYSDAQVAELYALHTGATPSALAAEESPVTIEEARRQCKVEGTDEDADLEIYIAAAVEWVRDITALDPAAAWPARLKLAVLLLVGEYYATREVGGLSEQAERSALSLVRPNRPMTA
ncbi:head-tail connector protein [Edaphosphingomonas haloaromaticamans]|uniref:Phage gp6-like head-tail connector protein n=1 Tax=Edaphosphingomonas haloaromaticamans TaxID=653954 RepID=A0A1S1HEF6_9SPHN|nr:head-tail connector protein [Sphingomonas haloaromaticamans]OHT19911.1 hypothetical protein BHE75_01904 [Sphingomonas haloaromaticamans]